METLQSDYYEIIKNQSMYALKRRHDSIEKCIAGLYRENTGLHRGWFPGLSQKIIEFEHKS